MKAWRVAKLQGDGPHLLEPLADPPNPIHDALAGRASQGDLATFQLRLLMSLLLGDTLYSTLLSVAPPVTA